MTVEAEAQIEAIMSDRSNVGLQKQLKKALKFLMSDPMHPGLNSHVMETFEEVYGVKVFSSYVQNRTPQAHRILWTYGPSQKQLTILAVIPHY